MAKAKVKATPSDEGGRYRDMLARWKANDYDNLKDAIQEATAALEDAKRKASAKPYRRRIEIMLREATTEMFELTCENPEMEEYAQGLIDPMFLLVKRVLAAVKKRDERAAAAAAKKKTPRKARR